MQWQRRLDKNAYNAEVWVCSHPADDSNQWTADPKKVVFWKWTEKGSRDNQWSAVIPAPIAIMMSLCFSGRNMSFSDRRNVNQV